MALFDWNHNGKKDFMDDYIEYNIYKRNLERIEAQKNEYGSYSKRTTNFNDDTEKENSYSSSNKSTSMADKVLITIGAVAVLSLIHICRKSKSLHFRSIGCNA